MARQKNKDLIFKTKKERSKGQLRKFSVALLCFVVVFGSLSVLYFFKSYNFDIDNALGKSETSATAVENSTPAVIEAKCTDYLFCSAPSDKSRLNFVYVMRIIMPEGKIIICPLPLNTPASIGGEWKTLEELYVSGGISALVEGVNSACSLDVAHYVMSTDEAFKRAVNYFGGFTVTVSDHVEYRGDFDLILIKGEQSLRGDSVLKYLRYLSLQPDEISVPAQAAVLRDMLSAVLNGDYAEKRDTLFSRLSNILTTDISIVDFSATYTSLDYLMQPGKAQYICVASPDDLHLATENN